MTYLISFFEFIIHLLHALFYSINNIKSFKGKNLLVFEIL